ncbi:hypothetical protein ACRQ5D_03210 [Mucilaginibacter sp. P25]|nr:hypothetical protein [Mucilaginibacter gossypii]
MCDHQLQTAYSKLPTDMGVACGRAIRSYACRPYAYGRYPLLSLTHFSVL